MRLSIGSYVMPAVLAAPPLGIALWEALRRDASPAQAEVLFQARKVWFKGNYQLRLDLPLSHPGFTHP